MLHILMELRPSGAEVMLRIAAPSWLQDGSYHAVLATGAIEGSYAWTLRQAGFDVFHLGFQKSWTYFYRVFCLIRHGRFDVVHIHTEQANALYGVAARMAGSRRIVHTIHNVFPYTGLLRWVRIGMRQVLRMIGAIAVAVGPSVAQNERVRLWNRTIVVPNWYDTDVFRLPSPQERAAARQALGMREHHRVLVTIGNCNAWKNHPVLFRALHLLALTCSDWHYLHAGAEDAEHSEWQLVKQLQIENHCSLLGPVPDPRTVLWAADLFVMPSLREGFSIAAIEAAACGLPMVLSDVPGLCDLKETMSDAVWVQPEPAALAAALDTAFLRFPSASVANSQAARRCFGLEQGARAYRQLYAHGRQASLSPAQ